MDINISDGNLDGLGFPEKEIDDENARLIYINDPVKTNERHEFSGNSVHTSKYSIITFIPRNLFEQFHRVAYIYFLLIAILNQLPQLAVFGQGISLLPLTFVLLVSAVKDGYEDYRRHWSDKVENSRLASVLLNGKFQSKEWRNIQVGEIIRIHSNETFPCDIVLLSTSDRTGIACVQTVNLDGESNLKTRYAKHLTLLKDPEKESINGVIHCEKPNRNIYGFLANMEIDGNKVSLGPSNIILRGCELKNTDWVIGVAVYAGRETKAMLNSSGAPSKRSRLETKMNQEIILLSFFLVAVCSIVSALVGIWLVRHKDILNDLQFYRKRSYGDSTKGVDYHYYGWGVQILFTFLMCIIMFQGMIPIALYISMELVRVGQAYFMIKDTSMSVDASKPSFQCRALNINEDLGQVRYVFSDKTGTLTENKMVFHRASIWGVEFSHENVIEVSGQESYTAQVDDGRVWRPKIRLNLDPELLRLAKMGKDTNEGKHIHNFFLALATCNTIVPIVVNSDDPKVRILDYQGESPDEQALVYAAASYGFILIERTSGYIVINVRGERQRFDVLGIHEFDSDRKRMSVILGCPDKTVKLFVKGADSTMLSITSKSMNSDSEVISRTEAHLHKYSLSGLRTLVVGMRVLNAMEFLQWHSSYEAASDALIDRATKLQLVADEIENNLTLLGATAIEDKLQNGVSEAIESLRKAGIKVWVLTGDKQETAISIGYSSKLLTGEMTQIIINGDSRDSCRTYLQEALTSLNKKMENALIIDGSSLVHVLDSEFENLLFELASYCAVVLCCRTAPLQKAGVVALIKNRTNELTLAIGDGANDVSMIQVADVGVGISGQEGRQAVMASDFAIEQFRFLVPLLLVHGHWNYQRISCMIIYNFYKNAVYALVTFWYTIFTAYTLTTAITDVSSMLYTVIYTALPTIVVSILDKDLSRTTLMKFPRLYGSGQRDELYNSTLFWLAMLDTSWQSVVVFFFPLLAYWQSDVDISSLGDIWTLTIVITVNLHLAMDVMGWNWIIHLAIWGSLMATIICVVGTGSFWLCLIGVPLMSLIPRFVVKVFSQYNSPSDVHIAREAEKLRILRDWANEEVEMSRFTSTP
ncbi:hypothetical protein V2J09_013558 [Rumex salicifolius]